MANFLTGIAKGTHQGLAHLAANKRLERQNKRGQRRYENELLFRVGQAQSEKANREKMLAYQKTRDESADQKWFEGMGFEKEKFAETKRTNMAREEDTDLARELNQSQFEATQKFNTSKLNIEVSQRNIERLNQNIMTREGMMQQDRQNTLANQIARDRNQTTADYYSKSLEIQEKRLNQTDSPEERAKILADIDRIKAQTKLYNAQTSAVGTTTRTTPKPTWMQTGELSGSIAKEYARKFADRGRSFTWKPWGKILKPGAQLKFPLTESTPFPYDEVTGGEPGAPTQVSEMQRYGGEVFNRLLRQTSNVELALQQMDAFYDELLNDEEYGGTVRNYMRQYGPENAEDELRQYFLKGGLDALEELRNPRQQKTQSPSEQIQIGPQF